MRTFVPLALCTTLLVESVARAEDALPATSDDHVVAATPSQSAPNSPAARSARIKPGTTRQTWQHDGTWGWFVVASSIFVGTGVTGFGLGQSCDDYGVNSCTKGTSLAIWGGIGIAALGTALGLVVVQRGRAKLRNEDFATLKLGPLGEFRWAPALRTH
jgi:hypothetical protein